MPSLIWGEGNDPVRHIRKKKVTGTSKKMETRMSEREKAELSHYCRQKKGENTNASKERGKAWTV